MKDHQKTQPATKIITLFTFIKSMHSILEVGILRGSIYATRGLLRVCPSVVCLWPQSCIYLHETRLPGARVLSHQEHPAPTERPSRHVPQLTGSWDCSLTFPCLWFHQTTLSVSNGMVRPNPAPSCSRLLWRVIWKIVSTPCEPGTESHAELLIALVCSERVKGFHIDLRNMNLRLLES